MYTITAMTLMLLQPGTAVTLCEGNFCRSNDAVGRGIWRLSAAFLNLRGNDKINARARIRKHCPSCFGDRATKYRASNPVIINPPTGSILTVDQLRDMNGLTAAVIDVIDANVAGAFRSQADAVTAGRSALEVQSVEATRVAANEPVTPTLYMSAIVHAVKKTK